MGQETSWTLIQAIANGEAAAREEYAAQLLLLHSEAPESKGPP